MIIYKVTNKLNGQIYIGQTSKSLEERKLRHEKESLTEKYKKQNLKSHRQRKIKKNPKRNSKP